MPPANMEKPKADYPSFKATILIMLALYLGVFLVALVCNTCMVYDMTKR
jgi:hypothetical protein